MKKQLIALLLILPLTFTAVSCDSDDNTPEEQVNPYAKYQGEWTGTFDGDTQGGTWTATFDETGKATGTLLDGNFTFELEGQVSENGEITAIYKKETTEVGTMTGTMTENSASGTWESPLLQIQGTWKGTKN